MFVVSFGSRCNNFDLFYAVTGDIRPSLAKTNVEKEALSSGIDIILSISTDYH